jgi:hypothetical protein
VNVHGHHNLAKSLIIIDVRMLCEPTKNLASLVPPECLVGLEHVFEDPLVDDNISTTRARNQVPSAIGHEGGVLFLHSHPPMRINEGSSN